ncbi:hypothetical protein [Streptomyces sp. NPDC050738]|uniref:hypothetical protein n=1 Tax=Streptomyces sp. NPDC050738 TaxID=3154744 RepID=UPI003435E072
MVEMKYRPNSHLGPSVKEIVMARESTSDAISAAAVSNIEEAISDGGPVVRNFPTPGAPLLNTFYFQYSGDDHHVQQVIALPDFPENGKIEIGMNDEGRQADYFFKVGHYIGHDSRFRQFSRSLDLGVTRQATFEGGRPSASMIFVLSGFQLAFRGADHHLDEIGIFESDGTVTVRLNDRNDDDTFVFRVSYCYASRDLFSSVGLARGSNAKGGARKPIPDGQAVIRGFNMNFRSKDHHIRDLGAVLPGDGRAEVYFEDKNGDDGFDWSLGWAVLR